MSEFFSIYFLARHNFNIESNYITIISTVKLMLRDKLFEQFLNYLDFVPGDFFAAHVTGR